MNILLIAATRKEIEPLIHYLSERIYLRKNQRVDVVVAGVGMMDTTYCLAKKFTQNKYTLAVQAGIAGSFHPIFAPGMVVTVKEDMVGDLGVMQDKQWQDVFDLGLAKDNSAPWKNKKLINPHKELLGKLQLECVRGLTVNQVSTNKDFIQGMKDKYMPVIESMEGAAFHYVCLKESIPFIQFRAISNMVGERDKKKWKMKDAVEALNAEVIRFLNQITDPY
ncbi:MAG TPA: futalosine hydrolase [Chitinophagaceae bacterium]|nr:futalosine hydrolase [Chitinophagaceae bacterium]